MSTSHRALLLRARSDSRAVGAPLPLPMQSSSPQQLSSMGLGNLGGASLARRWLSGPAACYSPWRAAGSGSGSLPPRPAETCESHQASPRHLSSALAVSMDAAVTEAIG